MTRDELFKQAPIGEDFRFTEKVAEVFDDMLARSVPNYQQVIDMSAQLLGRLLRPGDRIYDLGSSTGNTLLRLARRLEGAELRFIGVDNSSAMVHKARLKAEVYCQQDRLDFIEADITCVPLENAGAVILNYTLQFLRPMQRAAFLQRVHAGLRPGGALILSEKVICHHPGLNRNFIDLYFDFKRAMGYSEMEISRKREALENVLIPFSIEENRELLRNAGFSGIETFSQWFNFVSFVAVKEGEG